MTVTNEQFLFSYIKHQNGGTPDWAAIATECDIPTKGAASIKFRRMKEKHDAIGSGSAGNTPAAETPKAKGRKKGTASPVKSGAKNKKRKVSPVDEDEDETKPKVEAGDEEEDDGDRDA